MHRQHGWKGTSEHASASIHPEGEREKGEGEMGKEAEKEEETAARTIIKNCE